MKIINLQAENFKKLKAIEIVPVGNIVEITGKCEQGKTTVLDAIKAALCGEKFEQPVRDGADKGKIVVNLGDKIVTRTFTPSGGSLKVESTDGAKYPSPQALLDKLVGKIAFNPLEFARADSKKQVDMLLKVVDIAVDTKKLQEISGIAVKPMPNPLDMLNVAYKEVFDSRTLENRQLDTVKKTLSSMPDVKPTEPVSLSELVHERDELEAINRENDQQRKTLTEQKAHYDGLIANRDSKADEIAELRKRLVTMEHEFDSMLLEIRNVGKAHKDAEKKINALVDKDLTDVNNRITNADAVNLQAKQYQERLAKQEEVASQQAKADALTAQIDAIKNYKNEIIQNTKFPVPGLDFAHGGVTFDGVPFSQASTAQKMRVGIAIGMAANPELRVIMLDGYESLDSDQRTIVEKMAAENDFQVWTTAVDSSGTVGLYIEDGEIKNA